MTRKSLITLAVLTVAAAGLAFAAAQPGVQHIVGDLQLYNNDPFSDWNTAIDEEPTIRLDGSAGEVELGAGNSTAPDVVMSRVAANELGLDSGDTFTNGSVKIVNCTAVAVADQVDQSCFIADRSYTVTRIDEVHTTAESAGTLGIMPKKQEGTEAPASGQSLLSSAFDGTGTAETVQNGTLTGTSADLDLVAGDRLGLDFTDDTAGELAGVVITFVLTVTD